MNIDTYKFVIFYYDQVVFPLYNFLITHRGFGRPSDFLV